MRTLASPPALGNRDKPTRAPVTGACQSLHIEARFAGSGARTETLRHNARQALTIQTAPRLRLGVGAHCRDHLGTPQSASLGAGYSLKIDCGQWFFPTSV
jgi:hypothetical protein